MLSRERTAEPARMEASWPWRCRWYCTNTLGDVDGLAGFGVVAVIWHVSSLLKSVSFSPYPRACSGLSNSVQMKEMRGCGGTDGGVFKTRGSTLEAQDE